MDVDWVLPIGPVVDDYPVFRCVQRHRVADIAAVRKLVVDGPLTVVPIELEVARDPRRDDARQLIELRVGCRIDTVIRYGSADLELHAIGALASREDVAARAL